MITKEIILNEVGKGPAVKTSDIARRFDVSRQYAQRLIKELVDAGKLTKTGSRRQAVYVVPGTAGASSNRFFKRFANRNQSEDLVLAEVQKSLPSLKLLPENIQEIFQYAFTEMVNNAIEHSDSPNFEIEVLKQDQLLKFAVNDFGRGVFKNIMSQRNLNSELEAIQDLLKGKTTTAPKAHSGEGIFFTSKCADTFELESFEYKLRIDNTIPDIFVGKTDRSKKGTGVLFTINAGSNRQLSDVFKHYQLHPESYAFDKTEIKIKLYKLDTPYLSRSQARRLLVGLEKFRSIALDFEEVDAIGQAFADEIFRVFRNKHPDIGLKPVNMNEAVRFMVERVDENS